jgi:LTXXQ motif family protein
MTTRRTILTALAGAAMISGAAYVNAATDTTGQDQMPKMHRGHAPSAETLQHLLDGRIAMIKTSLQLTADQEKLWAPVEQVIRDNAAARAKGMADRLDASGQDGKLDVVARLELMSKRASDRAANTQKLADALKPLYATFTDEQKAVAMLILEPFDGQGRGHRGGHMMMRG